MASGRQRLTVWDVQTRSLRSGPACRRRLGRHRLQPGRDDARDGGSADGVELWDAATGASRGHIGTRRRRRRRRLQPDGTLVAFAAAGGSTAPAEAQVRDVAATRARRAPSRHGAGDTGDVSAGVALSPDGRPLAVGGDDTSRHSGTSRPARSADALEQNGGAGARTLDFSADGRILAISGFEPVASLWDVETGDAPGPGLHAGRRGAMADLSPDGKRC